MQLLTYVLALVALASIGYATPDSSSSALAVAEASYPKCALLCLAELVPESGCGTNVECLCTNAPFNAKMGTCVAGACTIYESLQTKNVSSTMCGAEVRDDSATPLLVGVIGGAIAFVVFALRMISGLPAGGRTLGCDDYSMIACVALAAPPTVFSVLLSINGLGKDMWTLPLKNIENVLFYYYLGEIFYFAALSANKISLLLFILRVFPDKRFRKVVYTVIGLCGAYGLSFVLATAFQCTPVEYSWLQIDSSVSGHCNKINVQGWMSAICNIILDIIILLLPLKNLYGLQIQLEKKLMIMFMFSLGIFVTIVSAVRLHSLIVFANSQNITWEYNEAAWWSTVELHVGIICACLPSLRSLFLSLGVRMLGTRKSATKATGYGSTNSTTLVASRNGILSGEKSAPSPPKHGDEGDFIPLFDVPDHKSQVHYTREIIVSESYNSDDKAGHKGEV